MAARPSADRFSLERLRLRADRAAGAGAKRVAHRHLGPHFHRDRVFASPATLADDRAETRWPWLPLALGIAVLAGLGGFGALRLARTPTRLVDGVHLRIMQPNLQQDVKFNYAAKQQVMERYIALSDRAAGPQSPGRARRHAF